MPPDATPVSSDGTYVTVDQEGEAGACPGATVTRNAYDHSPVEVDLDPCAAAEAQKVCDDAERWWGMQAVSEMWTD